ncbi:MAG: hypothetical protein Q4E77_05210 [Conchiformibius sp.]|nr:hypothetical protein [Conchiformibius sp.]
MYKKVLSLLPVLFLTACYYDSKTGCVQHLTYIDCPYLDLNTLFRPNTNEYQRSIDYDSCILNTSKEAMYKCMESKGYQQIK